jgi:hypothetical protein
MPKTAHALLLIPRFSEFPHSEIRIPNFSPYICSPFSKAKADFLFSKPIFSRADPTADVQTGR